MKCVTRATARSQPLYGCTAVTQRHVLHTYGV
jgi:hypothetical protein